MKTAPIAAMLGVLALSGAAKAQQGQNCAPQMLAALDMQTIPDGRVTIPVQLEGHDYRFLVDTGGFVSTVTPQLAAQEKYRINPSRNMTLKGIGARTGLNTFVRVTDFAVGKVRERYRFFFVDDFNDPLVDGTLVPSTIATYDVDFDFGHNKLNLVRSSGCPGSVVTWTKNPASIVPMEVQDRTHIRVPVTIDGKKIMATLDTGATTSIIAMHAASKLLGINEETVDTKLLGTIPLNGATGPVYNYPFKALTFGDVTVNRPPIQIVSDSVWGQDDMILGIDILRQLHLYIAYREEKLYITPALAN
jgi:predicted aspartyl protease